MRHNSFKNTFENNAILFSDGCFVTSGENQSRVDAMYVIQNEDSDLVFSPEDLVLKWVHWGFMSDDDGGSSPGWNFTIPQSRNAKPVWVLEDIKQYWKHNQ